MSNAVTGFGSIGSRSLKSLATGPSANVRQLLGHERCWMADRLSGLAARPAQQQADGEDDQQAARQPVPTHARGLIEEKQQHRDEGHQVAVGRYRPGVSALVARCCRKKVIALENTPR